jgi:hypothetical protein
MDSRVESIRRMQGADANPPETCASEAFRRLKLDLEEEQDNLDGA